MLTRRLQLLDGVPKLAVAGLSLCLVLPARCLAGGPPPVITVQPLSQIVLLGDSAVFQVVATSGTKLSYQWRKEGVAIAGATESVYTIAATSRADEGVYSVKVINGGGYVISSNATLTVLAPPGITAQPQSQTVVRNTEANFRITAIGASPLSYQWHFNGAMIAGATNSFFTIARVKNTDAGNYTVVVTNFLGSVTSDVARLTVVPPVAIAIQPQSQIAIEGQDVNFSVMANGTAPLFYQWSFNGAELAGATNSVLTFNQVQTTDAGDYSVTVWNPWSSATSVVATLTVVVPPTITTELQSQDVLVGQDVTLNVTATGTDPLGYAWLLNGTPLPEANSPTLTLNNVQLSDAGKYAVIVTNCAGAAMSTAMLLVTNPVVIAPPLIHSAAMTSTGFTFQFEARVGQTYVILATMNLRNWVPLGTNTALTGVVEFTDADAATRPQCHYRVMFLNTAVLPAPPEL